MTGIGQNPLGIQPPKRPLGVKSLNEKPIVIQDENETSSIGTLPKVNQIFQFISLIINFSVTRFPATKVYSSILRPFPSTE